MSSHRPASTRSITTNASTRPKCLARVLAELFQLFGDLLLVRHLTQRMNVDVAADPFGVDNDDRALRASDLFVEHPVRLGDLAVGPVTRAERVLDAAQRLGPRVQRV